jgi:quercetin dioxygenase-like cupin family protein
MLCRVDINPGGGHNFHRHPELEEIIYVIEGTAEQWVDREKRLLTPGQIAHIPRDIVHATFNPTDQRLVILAILSPAKHQGPFLVDVYEEEPWRSLR